MFDVPENSTREMRFHPDLQNSHGIKKVNWCRSKKRPEDKGSKSLDPWSLSLTLLLLNFFYKIKKQNTILTLLLKISNYRHVMIISKY